MPGLTESEKSEITDSIDDLVVETPKSKPAALKQLLAKAGAEAAGISYSSVLIN